ncbi:phosphatase PAP2 family protein [Actinomycetospora soli]|uniref:phosphatase PAP2 family protein n=1 Tax=Actinomycetospora soli TaxID=2893887 RepID=UPI001E552687|nr:phosphatase PAP2 family protein [Actinomycetospora soli]MCD2191148.1 phosphatase PAP2 family protein [Actinomycetospora soli]
MVPRADVSPDVSWFLAVNRVARATPALHPLVAAYALWAGPTLLVLVVAVVWWRARRTPDPVPAVTTTVLIGIGTVVALLVCQDLVSGLIARARPCTELPGVQVLLTCSPDFSMPSDHAVIGGAIAGGLWLVHRRWAVVATVLALLLAAARVYVGVHFPSDVAVGLAFGAVISMAVVRLGHRPAQRLVGAVGRGPARWLVHADGREPEVAEHAVAAPRS